MNLLTIGQVAGQNWSGEITIDGHERMVTVDTGRGQDGILHMDEASAKRLMELIGAGLKVLKATPK